LVDFKKINAERAIDAELDKITQFLKFSPEDDTMAIENIMNLGDDWDVPDVVVKALDNHPRHESRYLSLKRDRDVIRTKCKSKLDYFEAKVKEWLEEMIFTENIAAKMTANNAKPTSSKINNRFLIKIVQGNIDDASVISSSDEDMTIGECVRFYNKLVNDFELADESYNKVKIVCDGLKCRKELLISFSSLLGKLVDNNLIVLRTKKKSSVKDEDGFV
jgi:hypothetical protein